MRSKQPHPWLKRYLCYASTVGAMRDMYVHRNLGNEDTFVVNAHLKKEKEHLGLDSSATAYLFSSVYDTQRLVSEDCRMHILPPFYMSRFF